MMLAIRSQIGRNSCGSRMLSNHASCTAPCRISEAARWRQVLYTSVPSARCSCVALRASSAAAPILRTVSVSRRKCSRAASSRSPSLSSCSHCPVREYCPRAACSAVLILVAPGACRPPHDFPRVLVSPCYTSASAFRIRPRTGISVLCALAWSLFFGIRVVVVVVDLGRDHGDS